MIISYPQRRRSATQLQNLTRVVWLILRFTSFMTNETWIYWCKDNHLTAIQNTILRLSLCTVQKAPNKPSSFLLVNGTDLGDSEDKSRMSILLVFWQSILQTVLTFLHIFKYLCMVQYYKLPIGYAPTPDIFLLAWWSSPHPRYTERDNSPPLSLLKDNIDFHIIANPDVLSRM